MKKILKCYFTFFMALFFAVGMVACGTKNNPTNDDKCSAAEKVELATATLGDVEFENSDQTTISLDGCTYTVSGTIDAMSDSQKTAYGVEDVTHVVTLKFTFDKERTISKFEMKGQVTKVYSTDDSDENYVGSISSLLDSAENEDAYCYLILSANTESYTLTSTYTDGTESTITLKISATLATATAE